MAQLINAQTSAASGAGGSSPKPNRDFGGPLRVIIWSLAIFLISQFLAALAVGIYTSAHNPAVRLGDNLDQSAPIQFFFVLIAEGLAAAFVLKLIARRGLPLSSIGLGRKPKFNDLLKGLIAAGVFYLLLIVVSSLLSVIFPSLNNNQTQDVGFNHLNTNLDQALAFISLVILPPLGEETLVRGYLYSGLRSKMRFVPAMIITSLLFGLAHLNSGAGGATIWLAAVDTFILSIVLVYLRERTGALYAGMLVHALNNLVAFGVHFHS